MIAVLNANHTELVIESGAFNKAIKIVMDPNELLLAGL